MEISQPQWWKRLFAFSPAPGMEISLVGAGGKTTLLFMLAQELAQHGYRTAVSTTTHIFYPTFLQSRHVVTDGNQEAILQALAASKLVAVGTPAEDGKLSAPPEALFSFLREKADILLLESDGSKRLPLKVPRQGEPVLRKPDAVLALCGLSCLGQPLERVCHRWELAAKRLGVTGSHHLTCTDAADILYYSYGKYKNRAVFVLNQADDAAAMEQAEQAAARLLELGAARVVTTSLRNGAYRIFCP